MVTSEKRIAVILLTYNRLKLLQECIEALSRQTFSFTDLIIINNESTDGTTGWLAQNKKDSIVLNRKNDGAAGGFYAGVKYAYENKYDYVWLLDDDLIVKETALEELIKAAEIVKEFSFLSSKIISPDGTFVNTPTIDTNTSKYKYARWGQFAEHSIIRLKNATYASLFINTFLLKTVGLPNKNFYMWGDDIDFTWRLSEIAPAYLAAKSIVTHYRQDPSLPHIFSETNKERIALHFFMIRNGLYVTRKHKRRVEFFMELYYHFKMILICTFLKRDLKKTSIYTKGVIAGLFFNPPVLYPE